MTDRPSSKILESNLARSVHACVQTETDRERQTETDRDRQTRVGGAEELPLRVMWIAELVRQSNKGIWLEELELVWILA